jgi:hypothetical protein
VTAATAVERTARAADAVQDRLGAARAAAERTFFHRHQGGGRSLFDDGVRWIGRRLQDLLGSGSVSLGGVLRLAALAALIAGAVVLAVRLAPRHRPGVRARRGAGPAEAEPRADFDRERAAALAAAATDPREALRALYAAVLAELARRRGWRRRPGRTNWGYVRALGPGTPQAAALAECTVLFERGVYGTAPVEADDVRTLAGLSEGVLA